VAEARIRRRSGGLLGSVSLVGALTLLSRISGLARDVALSSWFGAGIVMDAFTVAFKIPNLLRRLFAEGAFSQAFVPVIAEYRSARTPGETRELIERTAGTLASALFVLTLAGVIVAPVLIGAFAPGFIGDDGRFGLASDMLRLTFPYLLFVSLTAFAGAVLSSYRRFATTAFTPVLLNVMMIGFAAYIAPRLERPGLALAGGVLAGGIVQLAFQIFFLYRLGLLPRPRWGWAHAGVRRMLRLMLPAIFGSSMAQISILLDTLIASFLAAGSISWLYYADRLVEFPLGVLGIAVATVILPRLSEQHARASRETFAATLDWALRLVVVIGAPAALGLALLAEPLMATLFFRGAFTADDVAMAAVGLRGYAPGLLGFILVKVLAPGYFARQDTRTPVRCGVQALVLSMLLSVTFVLALHETRWLPAHAGIAAATACAGLANASLLLVGLVRTGVYRPGAHWRPLLLRVMGGCTAMGVVLVGTTPFAFIAMRTVERIAALLALVTGAAVVYFAVCWAFGMRGRDLAIRITQTR
jgi:putative peptidoglycan lipid II flippase